ncbi:three-Cys-motif partner protein TcmP [Chroococcus sp. FPU101]|uniref:three-Cys-motif partner protein TcmP n=1 Tax=Chroococcus sp. FPU101 TaxID=1974212 RepID=UPI001A8F1EAF|nr:three-Cys-motif partner protein TcmP [Chroococcus sp. FPU101]GFE69222.1 hypothetical protein CFPU101_18320 [Chroococcus sp. FPU101]
MRRQNIAWSADGSVIPEAEPHTKAKHYILETYIVNLIHTLYGKGRYGVTNFTFIDGFCGGGLYKDSQEIDMWYGSPVKIIQAVREGYKKSQRNYSLNVQYIFIDNQKEHLDYLKNYAMPRAGLDELCDEKIHTFKDEFGTRTEQCEFFHGEFEKLIDFCILRAEHFRGHSFFLLDPCGWTDVSMNSIRKIHSLTKSEILYTFMIDFIARFITERDTKLQKAFHDILEADSYYDLKKITDLSSASVQCYLRNESMRLFRERGKFEKAFTFSMVPKGDTRPLYYLIHLSKSLTALQVIKDSFWQNNNLSYQYYFEIYGYTFRTTDYYEENQTFLEFDITENNYDYSIRKLHQQLVDLIYNQKEITFLNLCEKTMELNPANREQYVKLINFLRMEGDIEVIRNDKLLNGKKPDLQKNDIIKQPSTKQLRFF